MLGKLGSLPIAEKSATVCGSVFAVAVLPEGAGGLGELDLHEESSRWHLQGNLGGSDTVVRTTLSVECTTLSVVCTTLSIVNIYSVGCTHYSVG